MGDFFKQKIVIVVAYGVLSILIFFGMLASFTGKIDEQLNNYSYKAGEYVSTIMVLAKTRNENAIKYAISDEYFDDTYDNILAKQREDGHITSLCKEIESLVPNIQSVLAVMESGEVYAADDTFNSYLEQFKNIKNSEFYKDTCLANSFKINRYNKYYNVECYSYSNPIFDMDGRRVGTFVITYDLNWFWNEINALDKDDFTGTIIFETFDKQVLAIIDENGVERYSENELIGERAAKVLEDSNHCYKKTDYDREYYIYFIGNGNVLASAFYSTRTTCIYIIVTTIIAVITLTIKRKEKFLIEISLITVVAVIDGALLWFSFQSSYYNISELSYKTNLYADNKRKEQLELSFKRGVEGYTDYLQTNLFRNMDNQITTKDFANIFADTVLANGSGEYARIKKMFGIGHPINIYIDENRRIDFEKNKIIYLNKTEKEDYTRLIKSGESEQSVITYDNKNATKTIYHKERILSKYTLVFSIEYNVTNFYENNNNNRFNINELGETYFVDYSGDKYEVALIRASELSSINDVGNLLYVEANNDLFNDNIEEMIKNNLEYAVYKATDSNGNLNRIVCFNNKDLKVVEIYFLKTRDFLLCKSLIGIIVLVQLVLFATLLLYNYLEIKRVKRKEKKEEIILHGNY